MLQDPADPSAIADTIKAAFRDPLKLKQMTEDILLRDRPKMSEEKMIESFTEAIAPFLRQ
jgi:hypothetical protein